MKNIYLILSFIISLLIFSSFFEMITPKQINQKVQQPMLNEIAIINSNSTVESIKEKEDEDKISLAQILTQEKEIRACKDAIVGFNNEEQAKKLACRKDIEKKYQTQKKQAELMQELSTHSKQNIEKKDISKEKDSPSSIAVIDAFKHASIFIIFIYLLLFLTLWIQLFIVLTIDKKLSTKQETLIEWNINVPPILGVVGTIYSFASFTLVSNQQKGLFDIFKNNFYDAATTTVIGGSFYVINFAIAVWISSKLDQEA